jgi:hypothetical protein
LHGWLQLSPVHLSSQLQILEVVVVLGVAVHVPGPEQVAALMFSLLILHVPHTKDEAALLTAAVNVEASAVANVPLSRFTM